MVILHFADKEVIITDNYPRDIVIHLGKCEEMARLYYPLPVSAAEPDFNGGMLDDAEGIFPILLPTGQHRRTFTVTNKPGEVLRFSLNVSVISSPCPKLDIPEYGLVVSKTCGQLYGSEATYTCQYPFVLKGNRSVRCNQSGVWEGDLPTCERPVCAAFDANLDSADMSVYPSVCKEDNVPVNTVCTGKCTNGRTVKSSCSTSGQWDVDLRNLSCGGCIISFYFKFMSYV